MVFTVATVLTACGIETLNILECLKTNLNVATVLTACGIETTHKVDVYDPLKETGCNSAYRLRY